MSRVCSCPPLLREQAPDQPQEPGKAGLQFGLAGDLARNIAEHPAEIGLELSELAPGSLELLGVGIALRGDQRPLADPGIALAKIDPGPLGLLDQANARLVNQIAQVTRANLPPCMDGTIAGVTRKVWATRIFKLTRYQILKVLDKTTLAFRRVLTKSYSSAGSEAKISRAWSIPG